MKTIHKNIFVIISVFLSLSISIEGMAQVGETNGFQTVKTRLLPDEVEAFKANIEQDGLLLVQAALVIADVIDPANHRCCTDELPELMIFEFLTDREGQIDPNIGPILFLQAIGPDTENEDWQYWDAVKLTEENISEDEVSLTFETETSTTIAGFENVRTTLSGEVFKEGIVLNAVLGADGELFDETLQYTLELIFDNTSIFDISVPQVTVERVRTANGNSTEASFSSGASADNGETTRTAFSADEEVIIQGTINIDPEDQGIAGEIYVALLAITADGPVLSFLNEVGNYELWDQTISGLGSHISTDSLNAKYNIMISTGTLAAGTYRVALAYSRGSQFIYAPKAIVVKVTD